jgi:phosphate transport system substrate-binding protein
MKRIRIVYLFAAALLLISACTNKAPVQSSGEPETTVTESGQPAGSGNDVSKPSAAVSESPPVESAQPVREQFAFTRENFPRMDGSTSTAPLAEAVACVLLGEPREDVAELAAFNRTTQSFRNLAAGLCDILIVSEPSPDVFDEMAEQGFEYEMAPIATDALVFVVNASNPVESLTYEQIRRIYTGKIKNWSEVGGEDLEIIAFQRNAEAGSQVLMEKLVMDGLKMIDPPEYSIMYGMGELIEGIKGFDGSANAIGYTVFYYAEDMRMAEGLKIISVGGVKPGDETIRSGEYPFLNPYYVVISAAEPEDSPARIMYEWLLSNEGQALAAHEGYVSVR